MKTISFIAASSNSGKTTLIEKIVRLLKARGLRVAVIKHAPKGFDLDRPGKDSWRFREAGADAVVLQGPGEIALLKKTDGSLTSADIERLIPDVDLIIKEGFKQDTENRIEVFRANVSGRQPLCLDDPSIIALASDTSHAVSVPRFDLNDADGISAFIVTKLQL